MTVYFIDNQVSIHNENSLVLIGERAGRTLYHLHVSPKVIVEDLAKAAELLECTPPPFPIVVFSEEGKYRLNLYKVSEGRHGDISPPSENTTMGKKRQHRWMGK